MDTLTRVNFRPIHPDTEDNSIQRNRRPGVFRSMGPAPERRSTISNINTNNNFAQNTRMRNLSGGSSGSTSSSVSSSVGSSLSMDNQYSSDNQFPLTNVESFGTNNSGQSRMGSSHRKLDRSLSDSDGDRLNSASHRSGNSSRYKTELCRPFEESGSCKYGDKCQFAHGYHELRNLSRHPKYKTELCRTFHTVGFCPYGPRCHFLHEAEGQGKSEQAPQKFGRQASTRASSNYTPTSSNSGSSSPSLSPSVSDNDYSAFTYQGDAPSAVNKNFSSNNNDMQSLEHQFSTMKFNQTPSNSDNVYGGIFNSGSKTNTGYDIFSQVTMFNSAELLDNSPNMSSSTSISPYNMKLDNFASYVDTSFWQNNMAPQGRSAEPSYHSPNGSTGSIDGGSSDCSGSTESLASSGCRDQLGFRDLLSPLLPSLGGFHKSSNSIF